MATQPVSSDPSTPLQQVEKESIEQVKTIEKEKPDVASSGPEETTDVVVPEVAEVTDVGRNEDFSEEKAHVIQELEKEFAAEHEAADKIEVDAAKDEESSGLEPIGIEKPKQDDGMTTTEVIPEENQNIESSESLDAVAKEDHVEVKDLSEKIEVAEVTEVTDVGKNEDFSEEKAHVIQELEKEFAAEHEAADKIEVDAAKDEESGIESGVEPIGIEKPKQDDGTTTTEEAHVEQKDRDFQPEAVIDAKSESHAPEKVAPDEENEVQKEEDTVVNKEINDASETEQTSKEIELPADLEGNKDETVAAADKDVIEVEKKVDAEELHKADDASKDEENLNEAVEPVATQNVTEVPTSEAVEIIDSKEENDAGNNDESFVPEAKGIKEETKEADLPESGVEVTEAKSEYLDDVAKESSEKTEVLESSVPEASNVELEESGAEIPEAKDVKNEDMPDEKVETAKELSKESAETDAVDKFEIDGAKDEGSQANKVEGFELKSESVPEEDTTVVDEAKGNNDVSETSRDIELPTDIEGKKHETLASMLNNDKDIEVEKKIDAEGSLESETVTKREDMSDGNAEVTEESKEAVPTESTDKTDIVAAKDEHFLTKEVKEPVVDTKDPISETVQNIDPIKTEDDTNSIKTTATDVETEEKKEDPVVPEVTKKIEETTQVSDDVLKVDQTSKEIQLPADLEAKKGESLATNEEPQESKTETIEEEVDENAKLDAPNEESDDVKTTEETPKDEEVVPKQKQSNNLLSKVKQSLVKAKKAIIKKTPSKTPPTA